MDDPTPTVDAPSKPPLRVRRTQIALSVVFGVVTVAIAILWPLSYWKCVALQADIPFRHVIESLNGTVTIHKLDATVQWPSGVFDAAPRIAESQAPYWRTFIYSADPEFTCVRVPHWFLIVLGSILAAASWMKPNFSLRELLIATTLVAVVLGLGVWVAS